MRDTFKFARSSGDREFLAWLAARLVHRYGESPNVDFVQTLQEFSRGINDLVAEATWRTIDSAPRDGTLLLLWDARTEQAVVGRWHVEPTRDDPSGHEPGWSWWTSVDDLIMWDGGPDDHPTHWRRFTPPKKEAAA